MRSLLQTRSLVKRYGGLLVTDEVSLEIEEFSVHAIIGPNGAGKTTLINQLSGELSPDAGEVLFGGEDVTGTGVHGRARRGLVRSYQITSVFDEFTVRENAAIAALGARRHALGFWSPLLADQGALAAADEGIEAAGLSGRSEVVVSELGYGERRQLELAMALSSRPRFLLLDEPMAGMSVQESGAVVQLLASLRGRYTILLVEHDMKAVFALADRISVLVYGRIIATGTPEEIRSNDEVRTVYLGDEEIGDQ